MVTIEINEKFDILEILQTTLLEIVDAIERGETESPMGTNMWWIEGYEEKQDI